MHEAKRGLKLERARRKQVAEGISRELHRKQREVLSCIVDEGGQYIAALCGRRAGKTELDARAIAIMLEKCGADEWVLYAAVTRSLAKDLIWSRLEAINERHGLGWRMLQHEGLIETKRGGKFRVLGFDKLPELQKTRGLKVRLIIFDEPATYADKLETLIKDCVGPALTDCNGTLLINGTPGEVCAGFWWEASTGVRKRYRRFHWTVLDNPKYPRDARAMLAAERAENAWTEEDPTYQREWMARWIDDPSAQVYKFVWDRDVIDELPEGYAERGGGWTFTVGVDFGYSPDPCAWTVLGSPRNSRITYIVHDEQHYELLPDEAAEVTARLVERFDPMFVVGDPAGKDYIAEWNRRWAEKAKTWIVPADKLGKKDAIEVFNGELRAERVKVYAKGAPHWPREAQHLPWKNAAREEEHPAYPNHGTDSCGYGFKRHRAYLNELDKPTKTVEQQIEEERWQRIERTQAAIRQQSEDWEY